MARINLAPNPSFRLNADGWHALDGEILTISNETSFFGDNSLRISNTGTTTYGVRTDLIPGIVSGTDYTFSIYVYVPNTRSTAYYDDVRMEVSFYSVTVVDGVTTEVLIASSVSDTHRVNDVDRWEDNRISIANINAPPGATHVQITVIAQEDDLAAGEPFHVDALLVEPSSVLGQYFENLTRHPLEDSATEQAKETALVNKALTPVPFPNITGPELNADISLGRLVLNTIDEDGTIWICTDIGGWWGQSAPDVPDITRGTQDGSFDVSGRYAARTITLSGVFIPQNKNNLPKALQRLITETDLVRRSTLLRVDEDPIKVAEVRLIGQPSIETVNARGRTEFSVTLRAADPIKYTWNDNEVHGNTVEYINGLEPNEDGTSASKTVVMDNAGNASVTSKITVTGPAGSGSTIRALGRNRDESITLVSRLRDSGPVGLVTSYSRTNLVVTATTDADHGLVIDDVISFSANMPDYADPTEQTYTVTAVSTSAPYTFSYSLVGVPLAPGDLGDDVIESSLGVNYADVRLSSADTITIDTYTQEVAFNGNTEGQRSKLEPLIDWIKLDPGITDLTFTDSFDDYYVVSKSYTRTGTTATATVQFDRAHFMQVEDVARISMPTLLDISSGSATTSGNTVTITTDGAHGLGPGDLVDVTITEVRNVLTKAYNATTSTATITLNNTQTWAIGDRIQIVLPQTAQTTSYSISSGVATFYTGAAHGFVTGDVVSVASPALTQITSKSMTSGTAVLTTSTAHKLVEGGDVLVTMPTTVSLSARSLSGTTATMTTSSAHNFIVGDKISVALPTTRSVDAFAFGGYNTQLVTVTTTAAHGFSVGDYVTIVFNSTYTAFNGSYYIESIPTTSKFTFFYFGTVSAPVAEDGAATGSITNVTSGVFNTVSSAITSVPSTTTFTYTKVS